MELTDPPSWAVLARAWQGVQTELDLPAPAIAVSGVDGLQLWFSLAEPVSVPQAHAFLESLRIRFLPDVDARRVSLMPKLQATGGADGRHARMVPSCQGATGNWSAFVAPDLAPVFVDTPWIDIAPNEEGQAGLLRVLQVIKPMAFQAALARLSTIAPEIPNDVMPDRVDDSPGQGMTSDPDSENPRQFLRRVMNDNAVPLALRIEAAKALLQHER